MLPIERLKESVWTSQLNLDLDALKKSSLEMNNFIKKIFRPNDLISKNLGHSTKSYKQYNLFMYPLPGFHELYREIRNQFYSINPNNTINYYIECWVNCYEKGEFIDWHNHSINNDITPNVWHGFYCVNGQGSSTLYRDVNGNHILDLESENNQLVLVKHNNIEHKTTPWMGEELRITLAFNIVPEDSLSPFRIMNHWIPF